MNKNKSVQCAKTVYHLAVTTLGPMMGTRKSMRLTASPIRAKVVRTEGSKYHIRL